MMLIGWTTVENRAQAQNLAGRLIDAQLAVCVQIDGPITSVYRWLGKTAESTEFRLTIKLLSSQAEPLAAWLSEHHPYDTPQWIAVPAKHVAEKYLSWAEANSSSLPL